MVLYVMPGDASTAGCSWDVLRISYFGLIMVRDVSTKVGPLEDVLRELCAGWAVFSDSEPPTINMLYGWSGISGQFELSSFMFSFVI